MFDKEAWDRKRFAEELIEKSNKYLYEAVKKSKEIQKGSKSNLINTEFSFGKYHAIMNILKGVDLGLYCDMSEENKELCKTILDKVENF